MKTDFFRVMLIDIKRAFCSYTFLIAVLGVVLSCFATIPVIGIYQIDVVYVWLRIHSKSQTLLAFLFAMFPYGLCFYQDFSHKNIQNVMARISVSTYAVNKVIASIISCIVAFVAGKLLFALFLSTSLPLSNPQYHTISDMDNSGYILYSFLAEGKIWTYFFLVALLQGICAGILITLALLVSLYIQEKAIIFTVPIGAYYIINAYIIHGLGFPVYFNINQIYGGIETVWNKDSLSYAYAVGLALLLWILLGMAIIRKLKRRIYYE